MCVYIYIYLFIIIKLRLFLLIKTILALAACGHAGHAGHALTQLALLQFAVQVVEAERWNRSDEATARRPYIYIQDIYK